MGLPAPVGAIEADELEGGVDAGAPLPLGAREPETHVLGHGEVREERALLRDVADRAPVRAYVDAAGAGHCPVADRYGASIGRDETDQEAQQGRLAASGGAEDRSQGARRHDQVDIGEHHPLAVGLCEALASQLGHGQLPASVRTLPKRLMIR